MNGGIKDSYIEAYLGRSTALRLKRRGSFSFSIPAFVFSFFYLYCKKMYRECAVFLAAAVIIPLILGTAAGISRMDGCVTVSSVFHELGKLPLIYKFTSAAGGWSVPDGIKAYSGHEPAFGFWLARLAGTIAVNLCCGLSFERLQKRRTEKNIAEQLSHIKTNDEHARESILKKAGAENSRPVRGKLFVFLLWAAVALSHFYHTVYLRPEFFEWMQI